LSYLLGIETILGVGRRACLSWRYLNWTNIATPTILPFRWCLEILGLVSRCDSMVASKHKDNVMLESENREMHRTRGVTIANDPLSFVCATSGRL